MLPHYLGVMGDHAGTHYNSASVYVHCVCVMWCMLMCWVMDIICCRPYDRCHASYLITGQFTSDLGRGHETQHSSIMGWTVQPAEWPVGCHCIISHYKCNNYESIVDGPEFLSPSLGVYTGEGLLPVPSKPVEKNHAVGIH